MPDREMRRAGDSFVNPDRRRHCRPFHHQACSASAWVRYALSTLAPVRANPSAAAGPVFRLGRSGINRPASGLDWIGVMLAPGAVYTGATGIKNTNNQRRFLGSIADCREIPEKPREY